MRGFGYACALVLAAVFVRAAAAKLAHGGATAASFAALRVPAARRMARAVPFVELVLAAALIAVPSAGGGAALLLLAAFSALLVRAIKLGVTASCNCFGAARSEPVSAVDVARNAFLGGLAVGAAFTPEPPMPSLLSAGLVVGLCALALGGAESLRRRRPRRSQRRRGPGR